MLFRSAELAPHAREILEAPGKRADRERRLVAVHVAVRAVVPRAADRGLQDQRIGRRRILIISTALIGPALWGLLHSGGATWFIWGPLVGIAIGASLPVTLVMGQELFPRGVGLMSGFVLVMFALLLVRFAWLQVIQHDHYHTLAEANRISVVPVSPGR